MTNMKGSIGSTEKVVERKQTFISSVKETIKIKQELDQRDEIL